MITTVFYRFSDGSPKGFIVRGHAGSGPKGFDIVCAAVSSAAYLTANTVIEVKKVDADVTVEEGYMAFFIPESAKEAAKDILLGFELHMQELQKQYPTRININSEV